MSADRLYYKQPVFRPPSEAESLLVQATEGCTHRCTFCISNYGKKYLVRPVEDIKKDIDTAKRLYGSNVTRIFFLDGNAMSMPFPDLLAITEHAKITFPHLERVGMYACGEDILAKTSDELETLQQAGLGIVYVGLESGDDEVLSAIKKHITSAELVSAARKVMAAGITFSGTIILGLAGADPERSRAHAVHTAEMINAMNPGTPTTWYIGALTLMVPPHTTIQQQVREGRFVVMSNLEVLQEIRILLENIDDSLAGCVFRSNHASNYLVLKGVLVKDKDRLIASVDRAIDAPGEVLRPERFRGL
jgi:radical SAM superfamily enzyme YgiQ (UPF0313 family)